MKTKVIFTIDTEVYPMDADWRKNSLAVDLARDVYGKTSKGSFGLEYQLQVFAKHKLKAVFFVEALHASCPQVGLGPLRDLVQLILDGGHEVQLHIHPEWVPFINSGAVTDRGGSLTSYPEDEQQALLEIAADNLVKAGAPVPIAFRAGDYAANLSTLRALARLGFRYDSSYNYPYLSSSCAIEACKALWQPALLEGIVEVPISCFQDYPWHYRHCQLGACGLGELKTSLRNALRNHWQTYVLVSHSFELINNRWTRRPVGPRRIVIRRFEKFCRFLELSRDFAPTGGFADLDEVEDFPDSASVRGGMVGGIVRRVEQTIELVRARTASL